MSFVAKLMSDPRLDWIFRVVAILSLCITTYFVADTNARAECQARYNEVNNERTRALSVTTDPERAAEVRKDRAAHSLFIDPAVNTPQSRRSAAERAHIQDLLNEYTSSLKALEEERRAGDQARREHPVPPPPSELCA